MTNHDENQPGNASEFYPGLGDVVFRNFQEVIQRTIKAKRAPFGNI